MATQRPARKRDGRGLSAQVRRWRRPCRMLRSMQYRAFFAVRRRLWAQRARHRSVIPTVPRDNLIAAATKAVNGTCLCGQRRKSSGRRWQHVLAPVSTRSPHPRDLRIGDCSSPNETGGSLAVGRAALCMRAAPLRDLEASSNREERRSNNTAAARSTPAGPLKAPLESDKTTKSRPTHSKKETSSKAAPGWCKVPPSTTDCYNKVGDEHAARPSRSCGIRWTRSRSR